MTLGSLFDGSGGFPLAGALCGITPVWASEIEAYPLKVTAARLPGMKQLGDVTRIDGGNIHPVDIITFGSPCQDLSIAGKQKGIRDGERSNLFFEAVRIIREMRDRDARAGRSGVDVRPRFAVWENVTGAFSSGGGSDFLAVLQTLASIADDGLSIPRPARGDWSDAGCVVGNGWSIAWRVYDAQYWGVPQRRRRIYLVADFGGERAGEILFERESLRGDHQAGEEAREDAAADAQRGAGGSCFAFKERGGKPGGGKGLMIAEDDKGYTVSVKDAQAVCIAAFMGGQGAKAGGIGYCDDGTTPTLKASPSGGNTVPDICYSIEGHIVDRETAQNGRGWAENYAHTLNATDHHAVYPFTARTLCARGDSTPCIDRGINIVCYDARWNGDGLVAPTLVGDHNARASDYTALCVGNGQLHNISMAEQSNTLDCMHDQQIVLTDAKPPRKYIVRRLTPLECCRLQGFPDWWEDGVKGSDTARYKMWGNGIALPCAVDVLRRIKEEAEK